jgi:thioredoxin 1
MRRIFADLLMFLALAIGSAAAAESVPYDAKGFAAAQATDRPILVDIQASWCPICAAQKPILEALVKSAELSDLVVFTVDFDRQKDAVRSFGARMQSTLIVFKGKTEKGRSTGETDAAAIKALLLRSKSG